MKKYNIKTVLTYIIVPFMVSIFVFDIITCAIGNSLLKKVYITDEKFNYSYGNDRIHFLNTANSDCILIESNGHFALIDSGEGSNNPRRKSAYMGYDDSVIAYLKKVASDNYGKVHLDFIIGTHWHYDHIGGFHKLINDKSFKIDKAYFKKYNPDYSKKYEIKSWQLKELSSEIINDIENRGITLVENLSDKPFKFGDFTIQFFNVNDNNSYIGKGENAASVGIKLTKGTKTAFLASDITRTAGNENVVKEKIGKVDLLKIGHHGYYGSSSISFLKALSPKIAIVTNYLGKIYPNVKWNITLVSKSPILSTYENNGIIANFTDDDIITITRNIH